MRRRAKERRGDLDAVAALVREGCIEEALDAVFKVPAEELAAAPASRRADLVDLVAIGAWYDSARAGDVAALVGEEAKARFAERYEAARAGRDAIGALRLSDGVYLLAVAALEVGGPTLGHAARLALRESRGRLMRDLRRLESGADGSFTAAVERQLVVEETRGAPIILAIHATGEVLAAAREAARSASGDVQRQIGRGGVPPTPARAWPARRLLWALAILFIIGKPLLRLARRVESNALAEMAMWALITILVLVLVRSSGLLRRRDRRDPDSRTRGEAALLAAELVLRTGQHPFRVAAELEELGVEEGCRRQLRRDASFRILHWLQRRVARGE
ncbi:MAG: hypothetical protein R3F20_07005 [Planctomycetota bacterium]